MGICSYVASGFWDHNIGFDILEYYIHIRNFCDQNVDSCSPYNLKGPKDHINRRILHDVVSGIPVVLGLSTRKYRRILLFKDRNNKHKNHNNHSKVHAQNSNNRIEV